MTATVDREAILAKYQEHAKRFDLIAAKRDKRFGSDPVESGKPRAEKLTARETDVLLLIAEGLGDKEIGVRLYLAVKTVKSHVRSLLPKLGAQNRAHAVAIGFRTGLIPAGAA